eukprot:tig00021168_g19112.t1
MAGPEQGQASGSGSVPDDEEMARRLQERACTQSAPFELLTRCARQEYDLELARAMSHEPGMQSEFVAKDAAHNMGVAVDPQRDEALARDMAKAYEEMARAEAEDEFEKMTRKVNEEMASKKTLKQMQIRGEVPRPAAKK